jgi:adenine/guanine phosphoribosyltransferase-like PRPP-binding protein
LVGDGFERYWVKAEVAVVRSISGRKQNVNCLVDDVLATGGTANAICKLLHNNLGIAYSSMTVAVLINLSFLNGETLLTEQGVTVQGLLNE